MSKKFYAIFHGVDEDGGFGDAVYTENMMGVVEATQEEIDAFIQKWNKPVIYDTPYVDLSCHNVRAEEIQFVDLNKLNPYGEDDYYGRLAKEHQFQKDFEDKYGRYWEFRDNEEINKLYFDGLESIRNEYIGGEK